ncbi:MULTISPECIES: hypothetical protein [Aeromonas]|uniref:hypothetical protein n=1 Tax=Aeromonas TaxID=642 RepID=UPI00148B138B|nr:MULTISPECIES: hypothetical protein [Aeromonas]EHA1068549.1 hypothetical protein [Aeromonas hydrophila]MBM0437697.1 hypothetical protein [Aeromonas hydrophila subsp. ranae]MBW3829124.1 hypothetical protein [Aeromonas hydrophila]MCX4115720.1 hypothetical protein [Aeromonas hydrophila]MDD9232262.1 hypothetical protein [Aeromonas hydrophila]
MASTAVLLLDFGKQLSITLHDSHIWEVSGDPKGVLAVEGGDWSFAPTVGTQLIAEGQVEIVFVGWKLADVTPGANNGGTAYLFPETANTLGNFKVTLAV